MVCKNEPYVNELNPMPTVGDKVYKSEQNLHSKTASFHQGEKHFKCEICLAAFKQKHHLSRHIITGIFLRSSDFKSPYSLFSLLDYF